MIEEKIEWDYDEQEDEIIEKKSHKWIKVAIIIIIISSLLMLGVFFHMRSVFASKQVDIRNSEAKSCINAMNSYFEDLEKNEKFKMPKDKEYTITGYTDDSGMYIDPCELLKAGGTNYYWSHSKLFWAVKVKNGTAFEAWTYKGTIEEDMLKKYTKSDQIEQYKKHLFSDKVIGYYNAGGGNTYSH